MIYSGVWFYFVPFATLILSYYLPYYKFQAAEEPEAPEAIEWAGRSENSSIHQVRLQTRSDWPTTYN